ncbi:MAG TPA: hypothetical protein VK974_06185 [Methylophilaceae bacterium]|nr:hypothetical protein [Methylophilaceae bacterium]
MGDSDLIFGNTHTWNSDHNAIYFSAINGNELYTFAISQNDINAHFKSINTKFTALYNFRNNELWAHRIATEALNTISPNAGEVIVITPAVINARILNASHASPQSNKDTVSTNILAC